MSTGNRLLGSGLGNRLRNFLPRSRRSAVMLGLALAALVVLGLAGRAWARRTPGLSPAQAAEAARAAQAFKPVVAAPAPDAPALVAGFTDELVAAVPMPSSMDWTPDGRILVTTQPGWLYVIQNDALVPTPGLNLTSKVCSNGEQGMLGIAVDPEFAQNHFIYIYYSFKKWDECARQTDRSAVSRVSRFVLNDDNTVDPASEYILIDNVPSFGIMHVAGDLQFGKDGYLYIAIGDGACDYRQDSGCYGENDAARDQHVLLGKILRITTDGGIPPSNPWQGPDSARCNTTGPIEPGKKCQETFAWGLRNPFRMAFDPNADGTRFYINDVGENDWEEIDEGQVGADYGWNMLEGNCLVTDPQKCDEPTPEGVTAPIFTYDHITACGAITGGVFVPRGVWPAPYDGAYLFGDFRCGQIFQLTQPTDGPSRAEPLMFGAGLLSAVELDWGPAPNGQALYYTTYQHEGQLRRIRYTGADAPPVADQAFAQVWERTELPVAAPAADTPPRTWLWGPRPLASGTVENYEEASEGMRLVQYWDKGRMEVDATAPNGVSTGQLVVELVDGRVQSGNDAWEDRQPADVAIVGDAAPINPEAPTYRSLGAVAYPKVAEHAPEQRGAVVTTRLHRDGTTTDDPGLARHAVELADYDTTHGHNIADVFVDFFGRRGVVYERNTYTTGPILDWKATVGLPISEPYWVRARVGGVDKTMLVQAFERRILTYTPDHIPEWQVEMANVGQHYLHWRYSR